MPAICITLLTQGGNDMAAIIKKTKKGRPYYYAVESKRVNGKPRIVWQKYLGTIDAIIQRADEAKPQAPKETVIFEAGGVAALLRITQRLGLGDLIDEVVSKRQQGPSVGRYMVLAALNRALAPCSKVSIGNWYEQTILKRLWRFPRSDFSSQRFWDHMEMVSESPKKPSKPCKSDSCPESKKNSESIRGFSSMTPPTSSPSWPPPMTIHNWPNGDVPRPNDTTCVKSA
jgi:hypothetical protein